MSIPSFKERLKRTFLGRWLIVLRGVLIKPIRERQKVRYWERRGRPIPPPPLVKQVTVREYGLQFGLDVLVETGTYVGEMVAACRKRFLRIHSIELNRKLARDSQRRFARYPHITIYQGDSAEILPKILSQLNQPALFWLDAHYSGGVTVKGELETPIMQELKAIFRHLVKNHVLLIDDAKEFVGQNDYPSLKVLKRLVLSHRPDFVFQVEHNIIRIYPPLPIEQVYKVSVDTSRAQRPAGD